MDDLLEPLPAGDRRFDGGDGHGRNDGRNGPGNDHLGPHRPVILTLAVSGPVWLVRELGKGRGHQRKALVDDPVEILRRRYAAGEIDEDDYLRRLSGLSA